MDKSPRRARGRPAAALKRLGTAMRKARPPGPGADHAGYLYVPCYLRCSGQTRRWVQEVPIVRQTARWIYYASDSWDRVEAVVSPGCISRPEFETDTRCRHGYPAGVIPVPGACPGSAGRLFFATRQAAEHYLDHGDRDLSPIRQLRLAMADAHPDRGGTAEQFMQARRRYQTALRSAQG